MFSVRSLSTLSNAAPRASVKDWGGQPRRNIIIPDGRARRRGEGRREALLPSPVLWVGRKPREPKMQMERGKEERRDEKEGGKEEEKGSYIVAISGQPSSNIFGLLASSSLRLSALSLSFFFSPPQHILCNDHQKGIWLNSAHLFGRSWEGEMQHIEVHVCTVCRGFSCWLGSFVRGLSCCLVFLYLQGLQYCSKGQGGQQLV